MTMPMVLEQMMQSDRFARAQMALQRGEMAVQPQAEHTWTVTSKGNCYTVAWDGTAWTCTCLDFANRCQRFGLVCKHIGAVQIYTAGPVSQFHMEDLMTKNMEPTPGVSSETANPDPMEKGIPSLEELIWRLRQPLDMSRVKRRQASGQGTVPYLEGFDVLEVANDLFQFRWSFDLQGEPQVMRWDKLVTFYDQHARKKVPMMGEDGKPQTEATGIVYITGRVQVELGDHVYNHADVGRCIFNGDTPEALDMAIAGAATDCLKRCFRQLGDSFGLSLYDKEIARTAGLDNGTSAESSNPPNNNHNGSSAASPKVPPSKPPIPESIGESLQYREGLAVEMGNAAEVNAFKAFTAANQGQAPASREALRAWTSASNGKK